MMGAAGSNGQLTVPPGFRFHPTDEELLYYYLRKKVSYEAIDLDVIREVDLNKLEPWDLKDKCRIGSGPQNEWYFFSHKDKKYPTGTRTNRATMAGFWKATGRDKAIHLSNKYNSSKRIGMRKTLVFYTGRAPHGNKTDWIMHEYRLDDDDGNQQQQQEDGWVVCRVFKKKNQTRCSFQVEMMMDHHEQQEDDHINKINIISSSNPTSNTHHNYHHHHLYTTTNAADHAVDASMHLPQLFSPDQALGLSLNSMDHLECSQSLLSLTSMHHQHQTHHHGGDWSFLDKLLASTSSHAALDHQIMSNNKFNPSSLFLHVGDHHPHKFPFGHYLGCDPDLLKFSK